MRYTILAYPDGLVSSMFEEGARMGDGTPMTDFEREFDGSEPLTVLEVPDVLVDPTAPEHEPIELSKEQNWRVALIAQGLLLDTQFEIIGWAERRIAGELDTILGSCASGDELHAAVQELVDRLREEDDDAERPPQS